MESTAVPTLPLAAGLDRVIEVFDRELASDLPFVNRLTEHVRRFRGKLLRPRLLLLSGQACGQLREAHYVLAATVEMVHMATLVHDDVLDEADVRRHNQTVNGLAGNEAAVMLGDYLISHAYHLCSSLDSTRAARRIAAVTNTVCEGELAQIAARCNWSLTERDYYDIIGRKTAALTAVCCELGAAFAGADAELVRHMTAFGEHLGVAFQIVDDLLDLTATQGETGKTTGRDADLGKLTLPIIRFLDTADESRRGSMIAALSGESTGINSGSGGNGDGHHVTQAVRDLLAGTDAIDFAMDAAAGHIRTALAHLENAPPGEARDTLASAAEFVLQRRN